MTDRRIPDTADPGRLIAVDVSRMTPTSMIGNGKVCDGDDPSGCGT